MNANQEYFRGKTLLLSICALFTFTTFILIIVATAGSTANYKPLTNIYIGDADISHIKVTKVIPQIGPILTILGTALTAPNTTLEGIFGSLKAIADTPALTPLMTILSNAENVSSTMLSLTDLAPLAISGNPTENTKELVAMNGLVHDASDPNQMLQGLSALVLPSIESMNETIAQHDNSTQIVMALLQDSDDPLNSTESLQVLNGLSMADKAKMLPVFQIFQDTNNNTATLFALQELMSADPPIASSLATSLIETLQRALGSSDSNLNSTFNSLSAAVPDNMKSSLDAVRILLQSTNQPNDTLSILSDLIEQNITTSETAKKSFVQLTNLLVHTSDPPMVLRSVQSLALVPNVTKSNQQLDALQQMLEASSDQNSTISILSQLNQGLTPNSTTIQYIPSLFNLLSASSDPETTFSSLVTLTSWAQENPSTFVPIISILDDAQSVQIISEPQLVAMTPELLTFLGIPIHFRLSIFSLCKADINNEIISCTAPHAVQNMDFRAIVYASLMDSEFRPYLQALNITADKLHLDGKLQDREHEYVPSIKATLAMNLLAIIFSFFTLVITFVLMFVTRLVISKITWLSTLLLYLSVALFAGLGATVLTVVVQIIKSGTHHDNYGVVFKGGSAYFGLVWTAFALAVIAATLLLWACWKMRYAMGLLHQKSTVSDVEDGGEFVDKNTSGEKLVMATTDLTATTTAVTALASESLPSSSSNTEEDTNEKTVVA
ncbi:hypothetical protein NCAS_0A02670 [Naumovozyma castellii]|uniref:PUL domain-containing protein n=1 Tax=Naumovozyma castellii TaxID=27288 RepID=G0V5T7_NAUCA|nr:hypothetical protein NCAS_0A02670 [Naumovozyma castellii CBS 4309]CCC66825.1 hypothetical protein NCAS_0A02670 [Naumovozyma castellii CBS 4309]